MRKTQCDEDRYARESTLRAKSTLGSESLWKENSRLQEHQQRCQKQPSNPQRFHGRIRCKIVFKRPFSASEFFAVSVRWVVDGIDSWRLLGGRRRGRRPRPRRCRGSRPKSPSAVWQPERGGRCRSRTTDVRRRRLVSPAELHLQNLGAHNLGRRVVRVVATHFSQGLSHNVGMKPYEVAAAVANLWPIAQ